MKISFRRFSFEVVVLGCAPRLRLGPLAALGTATSRSAGWATDFTLLCRLRSFSDQQPGAGSGGSPAPRDQDRKMGPHGGRHKMAAAPPKPITLFCHSTDIAFRLDFGLATVNRQH